VDTVPSEQIATAIAEVKSVRPDELELSLERHVSTDAIRDLVRHGSDSWRLQFETPDHVVEVTGNDQIIVDGEPVRAIS
jgi:hypothetical protein